jgi:hypothetical protein
MSRQTARVTDTKKVSGELFSLTYGALVAQILKVTISVFYNLYSHFICFINIFTLSLFPAVRFTLILVEFGLLSRIPAIKRLLICYILFMV